MESALYAIRRYLTEFPAAEKKVAEYVLGESKNVLHYNLAELARRSGVSQAVIVRFCRRIGAEGFADFKLRLSHDIFRSSDDRFLPDLELESDMNPALVVKGVIGGIQRSIARLESLIDIPLISRAAELIRSARMSCIFGIGASGLAAQDLSQKLIRVGFPCSCFQDTDLQITAACNLNAGDLAPVRYIRSNEGTRRARSADFRRVFSVSMVRLIMAASFFRAHLDTVSMAGVSPE